MHILKSVNWVPNKTWEMNGLYAYTRTLSALSVAGGITIPGPQCMSSSMEYMFFA